MSFDSHFLGHRHAGYYLPDYETVQFPAVRLAPGLRAFEMRNRDTRLESEPLVPPVRNFIRRLPAADLHTIVRTGCEFIVGPAADLRFLFPGPVSFRAGKL